MKSNGFMAQNVVTRGDAFRNSTAIVRGDELVRSPFTRHCGIIDKTDTVNLIEFELSLVNSRARTVAVGKIVNHRSVMRRGPWGPLELYGSTGFDAGSNGSRCGTNMADDVWLGKVVGSDEAIAKILRDRPANNSGRRVGILHRGAVALIVDAVRYNSGDCSMSSYSSH